MDRLTLSGEWTLTDGKILVAGRVPGDVTNDLLSAGLIEDPYVGYNYRDCTWIQKRPWTYERTFSLAALSEGERAFLVFKGVDTYSEIFVNGSLAGKTESMHLEYRFDVSALVTAGKNTVSVRLLPVYDFMDESPQTKYDSVFHANRIFVRKAQCHFGWDWAPKFPGYGIYRDVYLSFEKGPRIEELQIVAHTNGEVQFFASFDRAPACELCLQIFFQGKEVGMVAAMVNDRKKLLNMRVDGAKLWWPNGYGEQNLYEYRLSLASGGEKKGVFGFREIALDKGMIDAENCRFAFVVNGRKIYARGSNWVPADLMTGRISYDRYETLLRAARDANFNMLRVWGGGIYESDTFYDLCDRLGVLVWQDFMFACQEIPDDQEGFVKIVEEEAAFQVKRLRNHPSLAYWCGVNESRSSFNRLPIRYGEFALNVVLRGVCAHFDGTRPYERSSPVGFGDIENEISYGDAHNNASEVFLYGASFKGFEEYDYGAPNSPEAISWRIRNYDRYLEETKNNFSSECAVIGACSYESLQKFMPKDCKTLNDEFLKERFMGNPYTHVMPNFIERQVIISESLYGKIEGIPDFTKKCDRAQAEILKAEIVYARSNGRSAGFLNWMYNDIWPTGTWSVVDYYLDKKPSYYAMKRCFRPLMAQFLKLNGKIYFCISNETQRDFAARIHLSAKRYGGEIVRHTEIDAQTAKGIALCLEVPFAEEGDFVFADFEWEGVRYSETLDVKKETFSPVYTATCKQCGETLTVTVRSKTFVPGVYISTDGEPDDNYFDLDSDAEKTILIRNGTRAEVGCFFDERSI